MRVDTREFKQIEKRTDPIVQQGEKDHAEYVKNTQSPTADDSEMFVRNTLEDIVKKIQEWFIDYYDFHKEDFEHFPTLDELVWHKDGWSIHSAIQNYYEEYNRTRNKLTLITKVTRLIDNESERLRNTVFDSANERNGRFEQVTITGDNCCENDSHLCEPYYGTYEVKKHRYDLPPYHWGCHCYAIYHD